MVPESVAVDRHRDAGDGTYRCVRSGAALRIRLAMLVAAGPLFLLVGTRLHFGYHRRRRGPGYDARDFFRELWRSFEEAD